MCLSAGISILFLDYSILYRSKSNSNVSIYLVYRKRYALVWLWLCVRGARHAFAVTDTMSIVAHL